MDDTGAATAQHVPIRSELLMGWALTALADESPLPK